MTSENPQPIAVDEQQCADAIGVSVHWLRKDRRGQRVIPFYRLGSRILYSLERVQQALDQLEEGGARRPMARRGKTL